MGGLRPIGSFLVLALLLFFGLRLLNVSIPILYPEVLSGPFSLDNIDEAPRYVDFDPEMPFYRPAQLGLKPIYITATRRPHPKVVVFWQGEHFLYLAETEGGRMPECPANGEAIPGHPTACWWQDGKTQHLVTKHGGLWIQLKTDMTRRDVGRIVDSLTPYNRLK